MLKQKYKFEKFNIMTFSDHYLNDYRSLGKVVKTIFKKRSKGKYSLKQRQHSKLKMPKMRDSWPSSKPSSNKKLLKRRRKRKNSRLVWMHHSRNG